MSLPVKTLSLAPSFVVNGKSLQLQLPHPLTQLPTRKIYNPTYFFNETYQHEIANHYRDYKRRSRISHLPCRKRHTLYVPYRRAAFYGVVSGVQRPVLPIAVHDFPRYTAVYTTPRGRRTLCEDEPPDDTYNATVRRIRQANTYKELKVLVERHWRLSASCKSEARNYCKERIRSAEGEGFRSRTETKWTTKVDRGKYEKSTKAKHINNGADVNVCDKWYDFNDNADDGNNDDNDYVDAANANDSERKVKANTQRLSHSQKQKKEDKQKFNELALKPKQTRSTENRPTRDCRLYLSTSGHKVKPQISKRCNKNKTKYQYSEPKQAEAKAVPSNSLEYFLHLACEYYEQGYLRNINYLQAIGARNDAHLRKTTQRQATSQAASNSSNDESVTTATVSATTSTTNTPSQTPRLTRLLRRIGNKRSFKVGINVANTGSGSGSTRTQSKATASLDNAERTYRNSCAIRVNIKPYAAQQTSKAERYKNSVRRSSNATTTAPQRLQPFQLTQSPAVKCDANESNARSMNDYFNANLTTTISTTTATNIVGNQQTSTNTPEELVDTTRAHFHDLIDHLMQLEISDIDASPLPKITLTDCSTINNGALAEVAIATTQTNDNAFAFEFDTNFSSSNNFSAYNVLETQLKNREQEQQQVQQSQQQQQVPISARRNGFTLRETKFGALNTSLEIPDEVYYNSEARPS